MQDTLTQHFINELNYCAIELLENFGIMQPTQEEIDLVEITLAELKGLLFRDFGKVH